MDVHYSSTALTNTVKQHPATREATLDEVRYLSARDRIRVHAERDLHAASGRC
jgi:hypothetical protein